MADPLTLFAEEECEPEEDIPVTCLRRPSYKKGTDSMQEKDIRYFSWTLASILISISIALLLAEKFMFHEPFLQHLAAIPLEIVTGVFIIESLLKKKERKVREKQLRYIKSYIFRSDLRRLFVINFASLKKPAIILSDIDISLPHLHQLRREAEDVQYQSLKDVETIIMEYVKTEHVWQLFMEKAMEFHFEKIVDDMIFLIHFINDVKAFKEVHPGKLFIEEMRSDEEVVTKVYRVLGDGIRSFLDYAIELNEKAPEMLKEIIRDYRYIPPARQMT